MPLIRPASIPAEHRTDTAGADRPDQTIEPGSGDAATERFAIDDAIEIAEKIDI